ncbi:hypothetical protein [Methylocystis bryophila]|uniref:Uncharacterized protein n=1 Tax=Methylocystis bryophila TaxID=655015 RepID=A0A1W6MZZ2_9HYPH|nr:hypothetical protein [Methylocystis bryophila]ARN83152.1 hypothetical protein B1812_21055 [Methylocystis bryophila]BDV39482.1 hypothetical protein DSM21852_27350 [Methylocystis bryophila]
MTQETGPRVRPVRFPLVPLCAFGPSAFAAGLFVAGFAARSRAIETFLPGFVTMLALLALIGLIGSITGQRVYRLRAIGALLNGVILAALAYAALGL